MGSQFGCNMVQSSKAILSHKFLRRPRTSSPRAMDSPNAAEVHTTCPQRGTRPPQWSMWINSNLQAGSVFGEWQPLHLHNERAFNLIMSHLSHLIGEQVERSWKIRKCQACANSKTSSRDDALKMQEPCRGEVHQQYCQLLKPDRPDMPQPFPQIPQHLPVNIWVIFPQHVPGIFPQHFGICPPHFHSITAAKLRRFSSAARRQWWRPPWQPPRDFRPRPTAQKEQCREHLDQKMLTAGSKNGKMKMLRNCLLILLIC